MSLFSRNKPAVEEQAPVVVDVNATASAAVAAFGDKALDALAGIVRAYGGNGFDIETMEAAELKRHCDAWARHLLTGTPPPLDAERPEGQEQAEPVAMDQRRLADMMKFFRSHRRDEQAAVLGSAEGMRGLIGELTDGLRSAISDDSANDDRLTREMSALSAVVQGSSLDEIRARLGKTVELVARVTREREARYQAQLQAMGERVHTLRADLLVVREKASLDALTRLHNRGAFDEVLASQIDFSFLSGQTMALMMLDLDNFKQINDTYGHPAGDLVLQTVANAIVRTFPRRSDFIARYGGEEFAVILVDVEPADQAALGERILEAIRALGIDYGDHNIRLTCSAGVAFCAPRDTATSLLDRADQALYQAKQAGRDRTVFATE